MKTRSEKTIDKFRLLSLKYHKLSLLFNELAGSLTIKSKELGIHNQKAFNEYLKEELRLDMNKILNLSNDLAKLEFEDLK